jgi:hypothetical protein
MARKPKASRRNDVAISPEEVLTALSDAPAPVRRGRKPKTAAGPEPLATMDSDDAVGGAVDADGTIAEPDAAPVRKRPGPKPKQRAGVEAAAPLEDNAGAKPGRGTLASDAGPGTMSVADEKLSVDVAGLQAQVRDQDPATLEVAPVFAASDVAPSGSSQSVAGSAQPAAHWDRATDTVRFEWAQIERTAAQEGPNQAMAKLLVAARAEGANSRWPL